MDLVLDIGTQRDHGALQGEVEQPRLAPKSAAKQPDTEPTPPPAFLPPRRSPRLGPAPRSSRTAGRRRPLSPRCPGRGDGLCFGDSRRELSPDHTVEQQIGGMAEDSRHDDADRRAGDAQSDHRDAQSALRRKPFHQPGRRSPEVAGPRGRRWGHAAGGPRRSPSPPRVLIARRPPTASRRIPRRWRSRSAAIHGCPVPTSFPLSTTITWSA